MWVTIQLVKKFEKHFEQINQKRLNQFSKPDFEHQQVHQFLTDCYLVYILEKVFAYGLPVRICTLIGDRAIFGFTICKIVIKNVRKKVKLVFEARF